jgi:hypothetical protein
MSLAKRIFIERRRVIVPVIVFLLVNVLALAVVIWLQRGEAGAELERLQVDTDLAEAKRQAMLAKDQHTRKDQAETDLRKFYGDILPKDFASARNMTNFWLGRTAANVQPTGDSTSVVNKGGASDDSAAVALGGNRECAGRAASRPQSVSLWHEARAAAATAAAAGVYAAARLYAATAAAHSAGAVKAGDDHHRSQ